MDHGLWGGFRIVIYSVVFIMFTFVGSYMVLSIYNFATSGKLYIGLDNYFYPVIGRDGYVDGLSTPLPSIYGLWFFFIAVSVYVLVESTIKFAKSNLSDRDVIKCVVAIVGLVDLIYFINRAAWGNIRVVWIPMIILLTLIADDSLKDIKQYFTEGFKAKGLIKMAGQLIVLFALSSLMLESVINIDPSCRYAVNNMTNTTYFDKLCDYIDSTIPEETIAFGVGVPEAYYQLNRKTNVEISDFSTINSSNSASMERLLSIIAEKDEFFAGIEGGIERIKYCTDTDVFDDYILVSSYDMGNNYTYGYFKRKN